MCPQENLFLNYVKFATEPSDFVKGLSSSNEIIANPQRQVAVNKLIAYADGVFEADQAINKELLAGILENFQKFDQLIQEILSIKLEGKSQKLSLVLTTLQQRANQAYTDSSQDTLQEAYQSLCETYNSFKQLEQQILSTPEDSNNVYRNQAIEQLKSLACQIPDGLEDLLDTVNIAKIKSNLEQENKFFSQFDKLAIGLREIEHRYSGIH